MENSAVSELKDRYAAWIGQLNIRLAGVNRLFLVTVAVPTLLAVVYFGLIASDVYISESRFVVRSPQRQAPTGLGALLQGTGFSRSQDDTYSVHDFMLSRDALKELDAKLALRTSFGSRGVDLFSRFNSLGLDNSMEALYRYYQKRITIDLDTASSISTLKVSAFTPEDAYRINEMLLQMGENLVNQLNERGRQDMIRYARSEVDMAEQKAKDAALALSNYRNKHSVYDPERQSSLQLQQISKLQDELIATQAQLGQVRTFTPDNPQVPALQQRVETLQADISAEMSKVAGGDGSLTKKAAEYERLALERAYADKQLAAALASLGEARNDAERQQLYLGRIVQPSKPDMAMEPRRLRAVLATFLLGMIIWGVLTILIAGIREHRD
jgi:capsular polysaccharide transport system permease protein